MSDIKKLVTERGEICISEIYSLISVDRGLIDHSIQQLVLKGVIEEVNYEKVCRGCSMKCSSVGERVYRLSDNL